MSNNLRTLYILMGLFGVLLLCLLTYQLVTNLQQLNKDVNSHKPYQRIALLLEGPTYDQGWNSYAFDSLENLKEKYGFKLTVADNLKPEQIESSASYFAGEGYDLILGHGFVFSKPFTRLAPLYPNSRFVSVNGEAFAPNQTAIKNDMRPAGFLIGELAALMSKTKNIGYIVVDKPTEFRQVEGFREGARAANPQINVLVKKVPDFFDKQHAIIAAKELLNEDVDVIYTTGDSFNLDVIMVAQKANIYAIGYIADQRYIAPNNVLVCLIQDVPQIYSMLIKQYLSGKLPSGDVTYGLREGVNRLSPFGPMVPKSVQETINYDLQQLIVK
ncbi:BMP family ABC transporter substrate-binding protein [Brevibacillus ginsengisoli]|uniref:BMP family ABC transporter substrate-binding protein n=1 Tax=Brevibacillus ginsengisoli TaxID=363854 RepID=UPI003CEC2A87